MKAIKQLSVLLVLAFFLCSFTINHDQNKKPKTGLISDTIHVVNYAIHLNIVHFSHRSISGYTALTITPKMNNVNSIGLYLLSMTVDSILLNSSHIPSFSYNDTLIHIPLATPINTSDTVTLKIFYHGLPQEDPSGWGGFYFSSDSAYAFNLGVGFQTVPHCFGRAWFPCVDDFIDRSTYDCYIRVDNGKTAVCGGTLMNVAHNADSTKTFYWRLHLPIPTYLASVAVANYTAVSSTFNGMNGSIPVKIYVPPADTSNAKASFTHLLSILNVYENDFGPYLWERVGYVGIPFTGGAMEHATNIGYPLMCINGNLSYESMYAHELSHHWFGDLVTCATAGDMWLNEGWASYCESLYREGIYGYSSYAGNVKANHFTTLSTCHTDDGGYFALYGIPSAITYGSTVYKKGADVIHTMRYYLGDSLFFSMLKTYLVTYKFNHISTADFRDFISSNTGVNMTDFFNGWVFSAGFPHYAIDSTVYNGTGNDFTVYVKQKLLHKASYVNSNKIWITFMNSAWQKYTDYIEFSGHTGSKVFHLPFTPVATMLDLDNKTSDARTDYSQTIKTTGNYSFPNSYFILNVQTLPDSAFFRVEHNWVAADPLQTPTPGIYRISGKRYWKIDGIFPPGFVAEAKFNFNRGAGHFDDTLLVTANSADSLVLLYRVNAADDWHIVNFTKTGNNSTGYITTENVQKGEYTFGIGKPHQAGIDVKNQTKKAELRVFPNPSNDTFNILFNSDKNSELKIYDNANNLVYTKKVNPKQEKITWKPSGLKSGNYVVYLFENGKAVTFEKIVYVH